MGSTRLIDDIALRAQLSGVTALVVDAKLEHGVYGVVEAIVRELVTALPREIVTAAGDNGAVLARFSPLLAARLPAQQNIAPLPPGELRRRVQEALAAWIFAIAKQKALLIGIDNAQLLDEGSAALLATLARAIRAHGILLVFARKPSVEQTPGEDAAGPALRAIQEASTITELQSLSREHVHELLQGVFGDVPNTGRLAEWLHARGGDNPQVCMDLARHLVESQVIRFSDGVWVLPQELLPGELPETYDQALDARLDRLEGGSRMLAEALSVHRGALSLERCLQIAKTEGIEDGTAVLDTLVGEDVLVTSEALPFRARGLVSASTRGCRRPPCGAAPEIRARAVGADRRPARLQHHARRRLALTPGRRRERRRRAARRSQHRAHPWRRRARGIRPCVAGGADGVSQARAAHA